MRMTEKGLQPDRPDIAVLLTLLLSDGLSVFGQIKILSSSVLVVRVGGIVPTPLLFLAVSSVGCITVVDHYNVEVSNLHWKVIHIKGRRGTRKARYARDAMRALSPIVSVAAAMDPITWDNNMELVRGNDRVVETSDNTRTQYLINES